MWECITPNSPTSRPGPAAQPEATLPNWGRGKYSIYSEYQDEYNMSVGQFQGLVPDGRHVAGYDSATTLVTSTGSPHPFFSIQVLAVGWPESTCRPNGKPSKGPCDASLVRPTHVRTPEEVLGFPQPYLDPDRCCLPVVVRL